MLALALAACQASEPKPAEPDKAPPSKAAQSMPAMPVIPAGGAAAAEAPAKVESNDPRVIEVQSALKAWADEQNGWMEPYRALKTSAEREAYVREHPRPGPEATASKLWSVVEADAKDDAAFRALEWLVRSDPEGYARAKQALLASFVQDARMSRLVSVLGRGDDGPATLQRLAEQSPHRDVRGLALYEQAVAGKGEEGFDEAKAVALLEAVAKDYGDVKRGRRTLGDYAKGDLREIQVLAVGKPAPEIEGEDLGGAPFRLSDYRGKVVMLDFWGDW
jgi:hypothetical protein